MNRPFSDEEFQEKINSCLNSLEEFQSLKISKNKIQIKYKNKLHKEDGPAVIYKNGREEWYINGKRHREDGPAVDAQKIKIWYKKGLRHREDDLPALITFYSKNNLKVWYKEGLKHRKSPLPAVEYYKEEKVSRTEWWNYGVLKETKDDEVVIVYENDIAKSIRTKDSYSEFEGKDVVYLSNKKGKFWFKNNKLHRDEYYLPAAIYYSDVVIWYQHGLKTRTHGPAMEFADGTKKWYLWDKLHRIDGPAIERPNGDNEWYENGNFIKCSSKIRKIKRWFRKNVLEDETGDAAFSLVFGLMLFIIIFTFSLYFYLK
jgi:hypothetical protein